LRSGGRSSGSLPELLRDVLPKGEGGQDHLEETDQQWTGSAAGARQGQQGNGSDSQTHVMQACLTPFISRNDPMQISLSPKTITICEACEMPLPPTDVQPRLLASKLSRNLTGVYFAWVDGECVYVGKSDNIGSRINVHTTISRECFVSFRRMEPHEIHLAELFYIWLLRPRLNSEVKRSIPDVATHFPSGRKKGRPSNNAMAKILRRMRQSEPAPV
jgi:hypothetical protein